MAVGVHDLSERRALDEERPQQDQVTLPVVRIVNTKF